MMTTIDRLPGRIRERLRHLKPAARLRRERYRLRRKLESLGEAVAERLRPANIDSRDVGRLVAAMTISSTFIALLFFAMILLIMVLYGPMARDVLRAMGFDV
jgi:hypothetical protein